MKDQAYIKAFGQNLKKLIKAKGMTPADVAAHGNIETKTVYRVINGEHDTRIVTIKNIAKGLGVHPKILFHFEFED
ncbi:MAG: helix-turn-helix transcriptional regulator [Gemmatimonadaceae bacterium]|nr:helix-turn-helix transcriptional regulator [Chitinophagaceae bacterium]